MEATAQAAPARKQRIKKNAPDAANAAAATHYRRRTWAPRLEGEGASPTTVYGVTACEHITLPTATDNNSASNDQQQPHLGEQVCRSLAAVMFEATERGKLEGQRELATDGAEAGQQGGSSRLHPYGNDHRVWRNLLFANQLGQALNVAIAFSDNSRGRAVNNTSE